MKQLLFSLLAAGAIVLSPQQTKAQCITALTLDGVDDYLRAPFGDYNFTSYTIEMWINSADYLPNEHYITIRQNSYTTLGGWAADGSFNSTSQGLFPIEANSGPGTALTPGSWHHIALVYNGTERIIYIDGVPVNTVATTGTLDTNPIYVQGITIGSRFDGLQQFTNTTFEDVRIWETARTMAEINANLVSNLTGSEPGLLAYYRFEDGIGSTTVTDLTGNGYDLTLYNMDPSTAWVPGVFSTDVQATDVISSCGPLTWVDGNTYTTDNNTATYTFTGGAAGGCDSIVTLNLTVNTPVDTSLDTTNSPTLTSNDVSAGVTYQWIDCGNGNTQISGETNQDFTATTTGSYAVIVTGANGCRDTSECFVVDFAFLDESSIIAGIEISPNPTSGEISIVSHDNSDQLLIEVMDLTGALIYSSTESFGAESPVLVDLTDAESGLYIVRISGEYLSRTMKVVKQ